MKWYEHEPDSVMENDKCKILWDFTNQTDHIIQARRPDIVLVNKQERTCQLIDVVEKWWKKRKKRLRNTLT